MYAPPPTLVADPTLLARALPSGFAYVASRGHWRPQPHLDLLTKLLVDLEQRRCTRLLVEAPPRHGKSELCSAYFPAWYLGRHPDHRVLLASYEATFAETWGERARDVLTEFGPRIFGVSVHPKRNAAHDWRLGGGMMGRMRSTGVGGGLMGRGAHLLIIDDPLKDAVEASSEVTRTRVWDWYTSTARTRLEPGGLVIVISSRWHQDDLIGRLRRQQTLGGEQWTALTLPAVCEHVPDPLGRQVGQALWPGRYDVQALKALQQGMPAHWWNALFQQRPTAPGGTLAKTTWFPILHVTPAGPATRCRFWDCGGDVATSKSGDPDWTVGARVARYGDRYVLEDIRRMRGSAGDVAATIKQTAMLDGTHVLIREEQEGGSSGGAIIQQRKTLLAGFDYKGVPSRQQKELNWRPFLVQAEVGNVSLLSDARALGRWNEAFLAEVADAPHGRHDDQLDAVAGAFNTVTLGSPYAPFRDYVGDPDLVQAIQRKVF